jgi:hypothetical protein
MIVSGRNSPAAILNAKVQFGALFGNAFVSGGTDRCQEPRIWQPRHCPEAIAIGKCKETSYRGGMGAQHAEPEARVGAGRHGIP